MILSPSSNVQCTFSKDLIPFCPHNGSNISRNYFLFRKAEYILKLFNFFEHSENIGIAFFEFRKVEYIRGIPGRSDQAVTLTIFFFHSSML